MTRSVFNKEVREADFESWLERVSGTELSAEELEALRKATEARPAWRDLLEEELVLSQLLRELPPAPLSSNFTARVLKEIELEEGRAVRQGQGIQRPLRLWPQWLPRFAVGICFGLLTFFGYTQYRDTQRTRLIESVALLGQAAELPDLRALRDFGVIVRLPPKSSSDAELLAALQ